MPAAASYSPIISDVTGIYGGLRRGGTVGGVQAGIGAGKLGTQVGAIPGEANPYLSGAGDILGIYTGLQTGGVRGDLQAGLSAAKLGSLTGALPAGVGTVAGEIAAPLALYNAIENWQSGATGSDALQGAEAGAAIGSIVPGIGTLIGGLVGGAVGAVSSIFGGGRTDPENATFGNYSQAFAKGGPAAVAGATPSQTFQSLAGLFDLRSGQIKGNIPMYQQYGRMGEGQFTVDMAKQINAALQTGRIPPNATPDQIYQQVVTPWMDSWGHGTMQDQNAGAIQHMVTQLIGDWQSGKLTNTTPVGISGQQMTSLPAYAGGRMSIGPSVSPGPQSKMGPSMSTPANRMFAGGPGGDPMTGWAPMIAGVAAGAASSPGTVPQLPATGGSDAGSPGAAAPAGGSFLSNLGGVLGDPTLQTLVGGAAGLYGANQAQQSTQRTIGPAYGIGQPFVGAGQQLLGQFQGGQLTPAQQQVVSTSQQQGQTLINAASPVGQIAQGLYQQYASGNLKPADQAQLDQQVAAAKAQLRQSLGPNVDSSMLATYDAQIDQQALQTKNQMLNSYLATGNQEFDQWATTTQTGQQTILAGQQYAVTQIDNTFQQALEATSLGGNSILAGIQMQLQADQQIASAFSNYMGNLSKGYAMQQAGGGGGGSLLSKIGALFGGGGGGAGTDTAGTVAPTGTDVNPLTGGYQDPSQSMPGGGTYYPGITDTSGTGFTPADTLGVPGLYGDILNPPDMSGITDPGMSVDTGGP